MAYKIENGKVYEVKEVNISDIEKEVKQAVAFVKQHQQAAQPFENEIILKKAEQKKMNEKYEAEITHLQNEANKHYVAIENAKASVEDKKDIIAQFYPEAKNLLGF